MILDLQFVHHLLNVWNGSRDTLRLPALGLRVDLAGQRHVRAFAPGVLGIDQHERRLLFELAVTDRIGAQPRVGQHAHDIEIYAVLTNTMPPDNITEISDADRRRLGAGLQAEK